MPLYLVSHKHEPEECDKAFEAFAKAGAKANLKVTGDALFCTCPYGQHGGTLIAEADNEAQINAYVADLSVGQNSILQADKLSFSKPR